MVDHNSTVSTARPASTLCPLIFVVFGRPGAGKSTVANAVLSRNKVELGSWRRTEDSAALNSPAPLNLIGLDLDVCVPQWMRDNFAAGIYPTSAERAAFADSACDYVESQIAEKMQDAPERLSSQHHREVPGSPAVVVSFSFVNDDLRASFRRRFPQSVWCLLDTTNEEASERIAKREGHFYKGATGASPPSAQCSQDNMSDKDDWAFAPVTFPHIVLDGRDAIDKNAASVLTHLHRCVGEYSPTGG